MQKNSNNRYSPKGRTIYFRWFYLVSSGLLIYLNIQTATAATSISQYGITWHFDQNYQTGQFVNGDYYVVDTGTGVTITHVTPSNQVSGRNGSYINPTVDYGHPYDDRARANSYDAQKNATFPSVLNAGDAVLSTKSISSNCTGWDGARPGSRAQLESAAVLTILAQAPPVDAFRPSYVDRSQTMYFSKNVDATVLPNLPAGGITAPYKGEFESALAYLKRGI